MAQPPTGTNLFALDVGAVPDLLAEANAALLARRDALLAAAARVPDPLPDAAAAARAGRFAAQLKEAVAAARAAKSADCAPLRGAQKAADGFFEAVSRPLDQAARRVEALLTRFAVPPPESAAEAAPGEPPPAPPAGGASPVPGGLPLAWKAARVDRAALDLDALRMLFTDVELDRAVARWLDLNGPGALGGVEWRQVVQVPRARGPGAVEDPA